MAAVGIAAYIAVPARAHARVGTRLRALPNPMADAA